ncbi:hypothetical protein HK100_007281, partial [Physocladia obscura]
MGIPGLSSLLRDVTGGAATVKFASGAGGSGGGASGGPGGALAAPAVKSAWGSTSVSPAAVSPPPAAPVASASASASASGGPGGLVVDGNALVHYATAALHREGRAAGAADVAAAALGVATRLALVFAPVAVVFDGPLAPWKAAQRTQRERDKLARLRGSKHAPAPQDVLAPLALLAAVQLLARRAAAAGLDVHVADGEADLVLARLARLHNAFIAGADSDFFIHRSRGYIPLDTLVFSPNNNSNNGTDSSTTVTAKVWSRDRVASIVGLNQAFLPLLAAIAGCDYCLHDRWKKVRVIGSIGKGGSDRIKSLITFLKAYRTLDLAIEALVAKTGGKNGPDAASFLAEIRAIIDIFTGPSSTSAALAQVITDTYPPLPPSPLFPFDSVIATGFKSHKL